MLDCSIEVIWYDARGGPMQVGSNQRFTVHRPCPICGGYPGLPKGRGIRCYGFLGSDGRYAHCTREELGGGFDVEPNSDTYAHKLSGDCRCGATHGEAEPEPAMIRRDGAGKRQRVY